MQIRFLAGMLAIFCTAVAQGALVWESTFDTDADGVVNGSQNNELCATGSGTCPDVYATDLGNGAVMIGANTGGVQQILTQAVGEITNPPPNKAGRPTADNGGPASRTKDDSWSALYTFNWDLSDEPSVGVGAIFYAGAFEPFETGSQQWSTRRHMGVRLIRTVDDAGRHGLNLGGSWATEGFINVGRNFVGSINLDRTLGEDPNGYPLQLAMGYDAPTEIFTLSLHDGNTGQVLVDPELNDGDGLAVSASKELQKFGNLGVPQGHPNLVKELNFINMTHIGWTDFASDNSANGTNTIWNMDSLCFFDDPTGAFDAIADGSPCSSSSGPTPLTGDANNDQQVTGADLIAVQQNFGKVDPNSPTDGLFLGDANGDGQVTGADLISVQQNFGKVAGPAALPEPTSLAVLGLGGLLTFSRRIRRSERLN